MRLIMENIESGEDFAFRRLLYLETAYPKFSDLNIPQIIWIASLIDYQNNEKIQEELNRILSRKKLPGNN